MTEMVCSFSGEHFEPLGKDTRLIEIDCFCEYLMIEDEQFNDEKAFLLKQIEAL